MQMTIKTIVAQTVKKASEMIGLENQMAWKKASEMVGEFMFHSTNKDHLQDIKVHLVLQLIGVENQIALKLVKW